MADTVPEMSCPACGASARPDGMKDGYQIARCLACGSLFVIDPPVDTRNIYGKSYFFGGGEGGYADYDADKEVMRGTFEKALDRIESIAPRGKLLDVGAATGYFLALAKVRGWQVEGIDVSAAASEAAARKGITVKVGTLSTDMYRPGEFNAVTLFDVVEHVATPRAMLVSAREALCEGGALFGSTPDATSMYARLMGKRWHLLCPPEHLVLFSERGLRQALKASGFEVLWTGRMGKRFTPPYIFQTAARWLGWPFLARVGEWLARTPLAKLSVPLDLRDNVFFLARRV